MPAPAFCRPEAYEAFRAGVRSADATDGLAAAAVAIARHAHPEETLAETCDVLNRLAETVTRRLRSRSDEARLAHLHDVLFDVAGYRGAVDDYYNAANSYLPMVLRTKRGIPISLVLVYKLVAGRIGLVVEGVNAPGHFLAEVRCREAAGEHTLYVDPFYGGGLLTGDEAMERIAAAVGHPVDPSPALLRRASPAAWLSRMLLNLQAIFARSGNEPDLHAMLELQAALRESSP